MQKPERRELQVLRIDGTGISGSSLREQDLNVVLRSRLFFAPRSAP
jgi:hypothetical protein